MAMSVESAGSPEQHESSLGREELASLVEFWRGNSEHFAPVIADGLEYIGTLQEAAASPFLDYIQAPDQNPGALLHGATVTLDTIAQQGFTDYKEWFEKNPDKIAVMKDGEVIWVSTVALVGYDVYPVTGDQTMTGPMDVQWVDEKEEK